MKRMKHRRKRKRMETGVLVLLIIFLAAFIRFYPTESEDRGNLKDNVTEAVKNARETLTASATEVQQTQKIKTGNVPQRIRRHLLRRRHPVHRRHLLRRRYPVHRKHLLRRRHPVHKRHPDRTHQQQKYRRKLNFTVLRHQVKR